MVTESGRLVDRHGVRLDDDGVCNGCRNARTKASIDWDGRARAEGEFFIEQLRSYGVERVLDVACGTGFHSLRLLSAGFDVVSADGSPEMLARAFKNAEKRGHILRTVQADWRWLNRTIHEQFDAVICLGNRAGSPNCSQPA